MISIATTFKPSHKHWKKYTRGCPMNVFDVAFPQSCHPNIFISIYNFHFNRQFVQFIVALLRTLCVVVTQTVQ